MTSTTTIIRIIRGCADDVNGSSSKAAFTLPNSPVNATWTRILESAYSQELKTLVGWMMCGGVWTGSGHSSTVGIWRAIKSVLIDVRFCTLPRRCLVVACPEFNQPVSFMLADRHFSTKTRSGIYEDDAGGPATINRVSSY